MKINIFVLAVIFIHLLFGCNATDKKKFKKKLLVTQEVKIPILEDEYDLSYLSIVKNIDDSTYVFRKSRYSNSVYVYNWSKKKRVDKIDFQDFGPNRVVNFAQGAVLPLSKNTFFIATINNIYETLRDSITYHTISVEERNNSKKNNYDNSEMFFVAAQNHFPAFKYENKIYCRLGASNGDLGTDSYYKSKLLMEYDLETRDYRKLNFSYPSFYFNNCWGPSRTRYSMTLNNKDELICLFPIKSRIYKYSLKKEQFIDSIDIMSKYATSDLKPVRCKATSEEKMFHTFSNPMFRVIKYDSFKDIYYLFVTLPIDKEAYSNVKNPFALNPFSIIVLDKDFVTLTEQKFEGGIYHTADFFITEEGLWISKSNPHNATYNEDELHFSLFTLKDEK